MSFFLRPLRRDSSISDPALALGARLLSHAQPLSKSEARKRRVWNALTSGAHSRLGFRLTALHVAFASVLVAAASSAAVGHYYVQHQSAEASASLPQDAAATAPKHARATAKRRATVPAPAAPAAAEPERPAAANAELLALPHAPTARSKTDVAARSRSAGADADAQLLVEAMRARGSGDAKRVGELTDAYRAKHPQGALQEEALILAIESAATRHAPNTSALGREYLARFPNGRFATQARRVLGEGAR